ncbi:family 78 glycoside hydrolase catalytic domain [Mucilaginibacter sp.]|uniref:family 78 glycoside hydrolase catalytic domain n=1 Tax=Mucilaginibacter sp. TaxID=1882438 RepID=UPI003D102A2B
MRKIKIILFLLLLFLKMAAFAQSHLIPDNLKCELRTNPEGVDIANPGLSYQLNSKSDVEKNLSQTAYQILVSKTSDFKSSGILWDSKKVMSDRMAFIKYAGKPLASGITYWWKIRVWDGKGTVSAWSKPATWTMGLLHAADWEAKWITANGAERYAHSYKTIKKDFNIKNNIAEMRQYMPNATEANYSSMLLRKQFQTKPGIQSAVLHISGLGQYECTLNGVAINKSILSPGWSDYKKTVLYDTYDITRLLKGQNVLGVILGNSLYNIQPDSVRYVKFLNTYGPLKMIAMLTITYNDGTKQTIGTDNSWQVSPGPITYSNYYGGEDFDKRLDPDGWDKPDFNPQKAWDKAIETISPGGKLTGLSAAAAPIRKIAYLNPVAVKHLKPDVMVYDLGQNASIMPEIRVKGEPGAVVRIIPSELLYPDGTVDRRSATQDGVRPAWWQYTIGSTSSESWFPKFFYQGGRYLQVEIFPAPGKTTLPVIEMIKGVVVHGSAEPIGTFSCSNQLFNRIYTLVRWAQRSNMMSIMTDCPQREKLGWLEQYHLNGPSLRYNFDLSLMFRKIMNDMADSQLPNGLVPNIAPEYFYAAENINNGFRNSPEWGSSFIIVPWQQYLFSGDVVLLNRYYSQMKRYVAFLDSTTKDNILYTGLGDWYDIGPKPAWGSQLTPVSFTATAIFYYDCQIMSRIAGILGKTEDAALYKQKELAVKTAFNKMFFDPVKVSYSTSSNTTLAIPLFFNLADSQYRKKISENLVADIRKAGNSFTSGEVGYRFLLEALATEGYSNVIYDMNNQTDKPGYGYQLKMGATALTEKWDAGVGDFGSQNHFMSGQINEWFFQHLIGISPDETGPGFRKFTIKPAFLKTLDWVKGSYKSISGNIKCEWKREQGKLTIDVTIPINTEATLYLPTDKLGMGNFQNKAEGVKFLGEKSGVFSLRVASGTYHFTINEK